MQLSDKAGQTLQKLYDEGSLRMYQVPSEILDELSHAGMVTIERGAAFNVVILTEDGRLTAQGGDAPEPDVSSSG